jgi:Fe-S cluster assembly iron-binding protein IscA
VEWDITVSDKNVRIMVDKKTEGIIYDEKLEFLPE